MINAADDEDEDEWVEAADDRDARRSMMDDGRMTRERILMVFVSLGGSVW